MPGSAWRAERNERSLVRLRRALPDPFPGAVLRHALSKPLIPPTPRLAVEGYWRAHPLRADRLARALAALGDPPEGWRWRDGGGGPDGFREPPAPFREGRWRLGPGACRVCGQPVYRLGWHRDLWGDGGPSRRASWHAACVAAWRLWTAPHDHLDALKRRQGRRCGETGRRLLRGAEVDHRVPLYQVWRDRRDEPWPGILRYWGAPNLQAINRDAHLAKCAREAAERARGRAEAPTATA